MIAPFLLNFQVANSYARVSLITHEIKLSRRSS
jgi:hypothetical protein